MEKNKAIPAEEQKIKELPDKEQQHAELPDGAQETAPIPDEAGASKELPKTTNADNLVTIGGKTIEIKPTKLKYQRNRTAVFYHILEMYPLSDILAMGEKSFGDGLDGDKKLYDWLVAVTDDEELIRANYDDIDSDTIYQLVAIFRRVNKINELEEKLKNAKTPGKG